MTLPQTKITPTEFTELLKYFPYLNADEWNTLLNYIRNKPLECPPQVRDELVRFTFHTRPRFVPLDNLKFDGSWLVFVLRVIWPLNTRRSKPPSAKEIALRLNRTAAMGTLLFGTQADFVHILRQPDLKPEGQPIWTSEQENLLSQLAYLAQNSTDSDRSFVYTWSRAGQDWFIGQVTDRVRMSREPYPSEDLKRGERPLLHHHTLSALFYMVLVVIGIAFVESVLPVSGVLKLLILVIPIGIFLLCLLIWGFPALLPRVVDFFYARKTWDARFKRG